MFFAKTRWYDNHPRLSFAVECFEQADDELKNKLANFVIMHALEMQVTAQIQSLGNLSRWYDKNPAITLAMEYFKNCNDRQRLEMAEHIAAYTKILSKSTALP